MVNTVGDIAQGRPSMPEFRSKEICDRIGSSGSSKLAFLRWALCVIGEQPVWRRIEFSGIKLAWVTCRAAMGLSGMTYGRAFSGWIPGISFLLCVL